MVGLLMGLKVISTGAGMVVNREMKLEWEGDAE